MVLAYTSGTTGRPKGVLYSHRGSYLAALENVIETGLTGDSRYLWTLPLFHCNGWTYPWAVTAVGATHVWLETSNVNVPGVAAYAKLGYTLCGADSLYYGAYMPEETAIYLAKML